MSVLTTIPGTRQAGLMSYFVQVISNLYAVHNTDTKLYVKFTENMRYKDVAYGENVWEYYFEQPYNINLDSDLYNSREVIWHENHLSIGCRPTADMISKAGLMVSKYINLKSHVKDKIDNCLKAYKDDADTVLAIHKRGTDHITDAPLLDVSEYFTETDKHIDNYDKILICSDEEFTVNAFKSRYGNNKVFSYDSIRATIPTTLGVHQSVGMRDPYKMGEDVIVESYLMSRSDMLIKTVSNVSNASLFINPNLKYISIDNHIQY